MATRENELSVSHEPPAELVSLKDMPGLEIADEDPDPRGWDVIAGDDRRFGVVADVIVDLATMKVRYLDCAADAGAGDGRDARHVLVPLGFARLDPHHHRVIVDTATSAELGRMPAFRGLPVDGEMVEAVNRVFVGERGPRE